MHVMVTKLLEDDLITSILISLSSFYHMHFGGPRKLSLPAISFFQVLVDRSLVRDINPRW